MTSQETSVLLLEILKKVLHVLVAGSYVCVKKNDGMNKQGKESTFFKKARGLARAENRKSRSHDTLSSG